MRRARYWIPIAVAALAAPTAADANLVCPGGSAEPAVTLAVAQVVDLVVSTVLQKGVAVLLVSATAVVSLPWLVAGVAIVFVQVPRRLKARWSATADADDYSPGRYSRSARASTSSR